MYNEEYELLQNIGSFGLVEGLGFQMVHHKMGAGYRRSILIGSREGERYWRLIYKVLPGTLDGTIWNTQKTLQESRADYLWNLFARCKTGYQDVNRPVRIKSPRDGKEYLAVFEDDFIEYEMFMLLLFNSQIKLSQVRIRGVNVGGNDVGTSENTDRI